MGLPYRIDSPLNVDMFAESLNNKFKGEYLNRKTNLRISSVFNFLLNIYKILSLKLNYLQNLRKDLNMHRLGLKKTIKDMVIYQIK